jgi:hypothetical protein
MPKDKFGVTVDEKIVREVDELVAECDDLGVTAPRSSKPSSQHSFNLRRTTLNGCEKSLFGNERELSDRL